MQVTYLSLSCRFSPFLEPLRLLLCCALSMNVRTRYTHVDIHAGTRGQLQRTFGKICSTIFPNLSRLVSWDLATTIHSPRLRLRDSQLICYLAWPVVFCDFCWMLVSSCVSWSFRLRTLRWTQPIPHGPLLTAWSLVKSQNDWGSTTCEELDFVKKTDDSLHWTSRTWGLPAPRCCFSSLGHCPHWV